MVLIYVKLCPTFLFAGLCSTMVDEEGIIPGHWLAFVLLDLFSVLTLVMNGRNYWSVKNPEILFWSK